MQKIWMMVFLAIGMMACTERNTPTDNTGSGTAIFNGMGYYPASASGGSSVSLSSYSGGNSGGGPGGGGPGGW